ncbi:MAG: carboxypeptidase regulatory-like domain-containing protein [Candidatus Moraniibacteriota bacterium]
MRTFIARIARKKTIAAFVCGISLFVVQPPLVRADTIPGITTTSISTGFTENGTGLFVGPDGFSRLLFLDNNNNLTYARCTDADCTHRVTNVVDSDVSWDMRPGSSLLTSGSDGFARIVYAKPDNSLWVYTCLDNDCSATTSYQIADGANGPGRYGVEIAKGPKGFPRVAYFDGWGGNANHFVRCLDADCAGVVDTVFGGQHLFGTANISLSMGTDGFARIVYPQSTDILEYARCTDADCTTPVITTIVSDPGNQNYPYIYPGNYGVVVRMGSDGFARIAYLNQDNALHYVTCSDPDCTAKSEAKSDVTVTTDALGSINGFGLAIRGGNLASIAYSGISDGYLHLINCTNVTCSTSDNIMVDSTDPSGDFWNFWKGISLVVDSNNLPRMLYVDAGTIGAQYVRFASVNGADISAPVIPTIVTDPATGIASVSATLKATLTSDGGEAPSGVEIKWGTQSGIYPNTCSPVTNAGSAYSCDLSGLVADTTYYVRASATNSAGTGSGSEVSFRTAAEGVVTPPVDSGDDEKPVNIKDKACRPLDLAANIQPDGDVKLSWRNPCRAIDEIEIERAFGNGPFENIATVDRDKHTYVDDGSKLSSGTYTYRIRGYRKKSGKHSEYSKERSVTITHPVGSGSTVPPAPISTPPNAPVVGQAPSGEPTHSPSAVVTQPASSEPSDLEETVTAAKRFLHTIATTLVATVLAGLAAGIVLIGSPTRIPLFATSSEPFGEFSSRVFGVVGFFGNKKREDGWGTVFDSETKQPLSGVAVSIVKEDGSVGETSVSDSFGHYGFLPNPGTYTLRVSRKDYELEKANQQDILYGGLYVGQAITIKENDAVKVSIALRTTSIDWQDFARRKVAAYTSLFSIVKRDAFLILFYAGFVINSGIVYLFPTVLNMVLFAVYLAMLVYLVFFKKKAFGLITSAQTGQPVPFTMLSIYDVAEPQRRTAFAVSDVLGRYFMLVENGSYILKASGRFLGGESFGKTEHVKITDGIVRSDVGV